MYASRRLYIALEAREGTISISFDKNKHCRGTVRAGPASVSKTHLYEIRRYPRGGIHDFGERPNCAALNWIQMQSSNDISIESDLLWPGRWFHSFKRDIFIIRDIAPDARIHGRDVAVSPDLTFHPLTNWNETRRLDILPPRRCGMCRCQPVFITDM